MRKLHKYIFIIFLAICLCCFAKPITILDGESNPVPGAYASLINAADSTIYDVAVSDAEGMVNFSSKPEAKCDIYVKCLGYKPFKGAFSDELAEVVLEDDATELGEVVVKGSGSSLKRTAGKFIFDPASLREISRNSLDIIKLTPLVEVDGNQFSIIGKGVSKVYINGRDPKMDSNTLVEMLKSLTPQQVKSVEIITAPGSSHSASYTGGIINVIIDRPNQGYRGSLSSDVRYRHERVSPTVSSWNSYAHEKLNISLSAAYNGDADHNVYSNTYDYTDIGRTVENKNSSSSWGNHAYVRAGAEYNFTPKSTLGAAVSIIAMQSSSTSDLQSTTTAGGVETSSRYTIKNEAPWIRPYYGAIAYYTLRTDDKGSNLDITAAYASDREQHDLSYIFPDDTELQQTSIESRGASIKSKYKFVFNKKHDIEFGYQFFHYKKDNDFVADINSNRFIYKETINSGYAQWNASWSDAFSTSAGFRVENTRDDGEQLKTNENFSHNYTDIYPSLSLSLTLPWKGNQNISVDLHRSISRPFYSNLNPFTYWTSETTCTRGNINQRPSYGWGFSLYYSFLNNFIFSSTLSIDDNYLSDYNYREGDVTVSSTRNFGSSSWFGSNLSYNKLFCDIWRLKANASFLRIHTDAWIGENDLTTTSLSYSFSLNNRIMLSKRQQILFEIDYSYRSPLKSTTRNWKTHNSLYLTLTKWFNNGMTLSLSASGLLGYKGDLHFTSPDYSYYEHQTLHPAQVTVKFNYTFGKKRVSGPATRTSSEINSRIGK